MSAFWHSAVLTFGTPMPTRASTENKRPDDEGRRRVGATLSPLYHPFAAHYLVFPTRWGVCGYVWRRG
jgi:hypothetical protein